MAASQKGCGEQHVQRKQRVHILFLSERSIHSSRDFGYIYFDIPCDTISLFASFSSFKNQSYCIVFSISRGLLVHLFGKSRPPIRTPDEGSSVEDLETSNYEN